MVSLIMPQGEDLGKINHMLVQEFGTASNIKSHHVVRPIPQDQIDRTQGGYAQNPGYPQ